MRPSITHNFADLGRIKENRRDLPQLSRRESRVLPCLDFSALCTHAGDADCRYAVPNFNGDDLPGTTCKLVEFERSSLESLAYAPANWRSARDIDPANQVIACLNW